MKKASAQKRLEEIQILAEVQDREANMTRARAVTVGTSFGGTTEVSMRSNSGQHLWCVMQPVEVIELIHQLAANVGCHINLQPRKDFSSWRDWKYTDEQLEHYRGSLTQPGAGWAPHVNDMAPHQEKGQVLPPPEQQPGLKIEVPVRSEENVVATKKTVNRRSAKRTPKTA
jgi:hypothetical protein